MSTTSRAARAAIAIVVASTLAACASTTTEAEGPSDELLPAAEGATQYPLELETPWGSTTLEERPQRIAILGGLGELEAALELGVAPVLSPWAADDWTWLGDVETQLADAAPIDPWADSLAFEEVLAAEPDLIVAFGHTTLEDDFDRLADIAPVLGTADGEIADWHDVTTDLGEALDLQDAAASVIDDTEAYIADAAADYPEFEGQRVGVIINRGEEVGIELLNWTGSSAESLLTELGFAEHPAADELAETQGELSPELLGLLEADGLLVAQHGGTGTSEAATEWIEGLALYQSLDVVQRGDVAEILPDPETGGLDLAWAFAYPSATSIRWTVDELSNALGPVFQS